jgi:hypothetical protein
MTLKLLVSLPLVCCAAFSQPPTTPPPVVRIVSASGESVNRNRFYASGRAKVDVLGLDAATGASRTWMIEMHPSFASIEDQDQALQNTPVNILGGDSRAMIAVLRGGYLPEDAMRGLPKARYVRVTIFRIRPEMEAQFEGLAKLSKMASPNLFYHVVSGDDAGTYIRLSPLASMRALDDAAADSPEYTTAEAQTKAAEIENSREHYLFQVDPWISFVSEAFAAVDRDFWRP